MNSTIETDRSFRARISITLAFVGLCCSIFIIRLFKLQIIKQSLYSQKAKKVTEHVVSVPAQRGFIYDRHGEILAANKELFSLQIIPAEVHDKDSIPELLKRIAQVLGMPEAQLSHKIPTSAYRTHTPLEIAKEIPLEKVTFFSTRIDEFPGLYWVNKPKRHYVVTDVGKTVNHVIGYVGDITTEELQILYNQGYGTNDSIGKTGIEYYEDSVLRGKAGQRFIKVDASGRRLGENEKAFIAPVNGKNIELTIDMRIQRLAEQALGNRRGAVVVLKPTSGEVLAMVSYPVFNASLFRESGSLGFNGQTMDPRFPFINRAIAAEYPPASCFKVAMAAAIIESGKFPLYKKVLCEGSMRVGKMRFYCHNHNGHGWQDLTDAIANSCNVYFWTVAKNYVGVDENGRPDIEPFAKMAAEFGYGQPTGIDLPGEKSGIVPSKEWKEETYHAPWSGGDTMNTVIGQGFNLVNVLQAADAISIVANRGVIYKPHTIRAIIDPETGKRTEIKPELLHQASVKQETWTKLQHALRKTVLKGTGWMLNRVVQVAGKTGTGEIGIDKHYHDWFVAYAPYNNPRSEDAVVVAVFLEATNHYEWWSSKIADFIFQGIFAKQTYSQALQTIRPWYMNWYATAEAAEVDLARTHKPKIFEITGSVQ